jgi:hypothetical protein
MPAGRALIKTRVRDADRIPAHRRDKTRWQSESDSNPRSLSRGCRLLLGEEKGPEVDQGGLERRRPFSRGDQRFESVFLHRRVLTVSGEYGLPRPARRRRYLPRSLAEGEARWGRGRAVGTTIGVEPSDDLIEHTAQAFKRDGDFDPHREPAFGVPNSLPHRSHEAARR